MFSRTNYGFTSYFEHQVSLLLSMSSVCMTPIIFVECSRTVNISGRAPWVVRTLMVTFMLIVSVCRVHNSFFV